MTGLLLQKPLYDKYLYAIVVSGYSGGDLVARQILGALCLNKTMMLPPISASSRPPTTPAPPLSAPGVEERMEAWAQDILSTIYLPHGA